jgi:hypothetical protein
MNERTDDETIDGDNPASGADTHQSQVAQRLYEPDEDGELTTAIIYAIAAAEGVSPGNMKLPPLYESVDVPAIEDAFFGVNISEASQQGVGTVEFRYTDYLVKVQSDGWIQVYEPTEPHLS